ncbi:MAG: hypothetical protein IT166_24605 [Bryobacterales bacterium]|nr:hypothetical protein [Bryobacterales bacterium]
MKFATLSLVLLALSCARHGPRAIAVPTRGEPYALSLHDDVLSFCDSRGARQLDLKANRETAAARACSPSEPNAACGGLPFDVDVRSPLNEPNDIVDAGDASFPLNGRVHDCAASGKLLAIATGAQVILIDTVNGAVRVAYPHGAERVAIGPGWIAWTDASTLHAQPLLTH